MYACNQPLNFDINVGTLYFYSQLLHFSKTITGNFKNVFGFDLNFVFSYIVLPLTILFTLNLNFENELFVLSAF